MRQLAEHYQKSPDQITEEELRQYFLFIKNVKKYARGTSTIAICGIKFFFEHAQSTVDNPGPCSRRSGA